MTVGEVMDILLILFKVYALVLFLVFCFFLKIWFNRDRQEKRQQKERDAFVVSVYDTIDKLPLG